METLLEQQRRYHEERERVIDAMCSESIHPAKTPKEHINSDHRMRQLLDRFMDCSVQLRDLYEDNDGLRKEELSALSGPNEFAEFYSRLKSIKDFHKKHPNEICVPMSVEFLDIARQREGTTEENIVDFNDEEGYGKFLDLHECHEKFLNLKGVTKADYLTYLGTFDHLFDIPKDRKNTAYREYLQLLLEYLEGYVTRVKPLLDLGQEFQKLQTSFDEQWTNGTFPGWPKETAGALTHSGAHLDLSSFSSAEELASLGLDRLKSALMALDLKCGGTLDQRAERLFATKGKSNDEFDPSALAKPNAEKALKKRTQEKYVEVAFLEAQVYHLVELLSEQRAATKENVERKQARSGGERLEEDEDELSDPESEPGDDDVPYNPKNLPLGWDGKPIPYWLYRLHGLNMYFNCEICGNFKYRGPKMFQRHFSEWRHAHGMRCLGIPNTAHFANITQIEDAMALWQKLKSTKEAERWRPDMEEEFEDNAGNVVNKKTFDDLKRQGLL